MIKLPGCQVYMIDACLILLVLNNGDEFLPRFRCRSKYGPKPVMGICLGPDSLGDVSVGDPVYVKYK